MRQWKVQSSVIGVAGRTRDIVLDTVFPPQSLLTGRPVTAGEEEGELWSSVTFLDNPCCAACGFPFEFDEGNPVPLHPSRLRARRYNQSTLLCRAIDKRRFDPDVLMRTKKTVSQGGQTVSGRRRNVSGAFAVRSGAMSRLAGKRVVLIDDVFTTGATLESCARALRKGGAKSVDAITLARVVKAQHVPT